MLACLVLLVRSWFVCILAFFKFFVVVVFVLFVLHWLVYMLAFMVLLVRCFVCLLLCLFVVVLLTMGAAGNVLPSATEFLPLRPDSVCRVSYLLVSPPPGGVTQHGQSVKDHAQSLFADDAVSSIECFLFTLRLSLDVTVRG